MKLHTFLNLVRWDRPTGWLLLLWPTLSSLWLFKGGFPGWHLVLVFTLGTLLMRSAGCCINDIADKKFDLYVARTADRPVATGEVSVKQAFLCSFVLILLSFGLVLTTNLPTIVVSALALALSVVYPFTKRFLSVPQAALGLAYGMGIPMAFMAIEGSNASWHSAFTYPGAGWAWLLVLGNFFWVIAYDTEYAMVDKKDDLKLGIKTSAITFGSYDIFMIIICYVLFLFIWSEAGFRLSARWPYWIGLFAAVIQVYWHYTLIEERDPAKCYKAFLKNHWIGFSIFAGVLASSLLPGHMF